MANTGDDGNRFDVPSAGSDDTTEVRELSEEDLREEERAREKAEQEKAEAGSYGTSQDVLPVEEIEFEISTLGGLGDAFVFPLPYGLLKNGEVLREAEIRKMTGREENLFTDKKKVMSGKVFDDVLEACVVRIGGQKGLDEKDLPHLTVADKSMLMVKLRIASIEEGYPIRLLCPVCEVHFDFEVNLNTLVARLSKKSEYRKFRASMSDGRDVVFRPLTIADEVRVRNLRTKYRDQLVTSMMSLRIISIDGNPIGPNALLDWPSGDLREIRSMFFDYDAGLETSCEFRCTNPDCEYVFEEDLPIQQDFFGFGTRPRSRVVS